MELQIVVFVLEGEEYALELRHVLEVARGAGLHPLREPAPPAVGMIRASNGSDVPVVRARERLRLPEGPPAEHTIILRHSSGLAVGVQVDAVREVATTTPEAVLPPPQLFRASGKGEVKGLVRLAEVRLVVLLSPGALLTEDDMRRLSVAAPLEDSRTDPETPRRDS
jgi:chemotaxis signal transduction protein